MARNIEIKAHIKSVENIAPKAAAIADKGPVQIIQDDTFFNCESGRLKLRALSDVEGELIFYRRGTQQGPKESLPSFADICTMSSCASWTPGMTGRRRVSLIFIQ